MEKRKRSGQNQEIFFKNRISDRFEWYLGVEEEDDIIGNTFRVSI